MVTLSSVRIDPVNPVSGAGRGPVNLGADRIINA
jgi:hypothetical protein